MAIQTAVIIGRFQPYHNGHKAIVDRALKEFDHVIVLIGSAGQPRTRKNPWTWNERADMVVAAHPKDEHRLSVMALFDVPGDDKAWAERVVGVVQGAAPVTHRADGSVVPPDITLVGHRKDESSFYLDLFPEWKLLEVESQGFRSGTEIRKDYFDADGSFEDKVDKDVPMSTLARMQQYITSSVLNELKGQA
jgi:bifunctional NMN adenylyltransferase/nudix hydrolase